jgi:transposase
MKFRALITCSLAASFLAFGPIKAEEEKTLKEKTVDATETVKEKTAKAAETVIETTKEAWKKTKAFLSQDAKTYRDGASEKLKEIDREIEKLQSDGKAGKLRARAYFKTRISALAQHHDYAVRELNRLPKDKQTAGYDDARKRFDDTLEDLENALAEARSEVRNES